MKLRTAIAIALAATFVLGVSAIVVGMRSFVGKRSVLFETDCKGANGHSPSGEPITSCAGTPHTHLVIDGREAGSAGLRALSPGARVVFTVTAGSDDTLRGLQDHPPRVSKDARRTLGRRVRKMHCHDSVNCPRKADGSYDAAFTSAITRAFWRSS